MIVGIREKDAVIIKFTDKIRDAVWDALREEKTVSIGNLHFMIDVFASDTPFQGAKEQ